MTGRFAAMLAIMVLSLSFGVQATPVAAAFQCSLTPGSVVELVGTPHLFIVDQQQVLHWGGDTRALAGQNIDWNNRCRVGLDGFRAMQRGDPWLSSGLPKIGEPIYLSKWEDSDQAPTLLHIQSIPDVELFGINERNYGSFVLDAPVWEARFGFDVGSLQVGPLASAASFAWSSNDQNNYGQLLVNLTNVLSAHLFRGVQAGIDPVLILPSIAQCERAGLNDFDRSRNAGASLGVTQDCLSRLNAGGPGPGPNPGPGPGPNPGPGGGPIPAFPPGNVRVIALSPTQIRITWTDVPNEFGFRIYAIDQLQPGAAYLTGTPGNVVSQDIPDRTPGTQYCYAVSAFNPAGESPLSAPACASTPPATAPGGLVAPSNVRISQISIGSGTSGLRIDWTDNATTETGFQIQRGEQVIATVAANSNTFSDMTWDPAVSKCYRVIATNEAAQAPSDQVCLDGGQNGAPGAPTDLTAIVLPGAQGVQLNWTDASNNETGFQIVRGGENIAILAAGTVTYTDAGYSPAAQSCYRVVAFNNAGQTRSERACPTASQTQPAAPSSLTMVQAPGTVRTFRLDWTDNANNEDGYQILRNNTMVAALGPNAVTFTDPGASMGQSCYRVAAYNTVGAAYSNEACMTIGGTVP